MDEEQKLFNKLRQTPINEVLDLLEEIKRPSPLYNFNGKTYERASFYPEITFYLERVNLLKQHGWEVEDFYTELEKRGILEMIKSYNEAIEFPADILDRARKIFPKIKFTPAKIELG